MKNNPKAMVLVIFALVIVGLLKVLPMSPMYQSPKLGLDLKGGSRLVLQAVPTADVPTITGSVMKSLQQVIDRRVNKMGIAESVVQQAGEKRLLVEIPGVNDPEEAKKMLGKAGNLEFKEFKNNEWISTGVSGKDLAKAEPSTNATGQWTILFELKPEGAKKFGDLTARLAPNKEPLGIFFDGEMFSAPRVNSPILQGSGQIEGDFTQEAAQEVVNILNAGALPVDIEIIQETTVGPLLGQASIKSSLFAGLIGLGMVAIFMVGYYRLQGFVADLALLVYTLLTYTAFMMLGVTFTLAGIAGFILSVGMAVDANILIFERTKEEIRHGRSLWKSIEVGFDRAFPSIFDSNTTTLITCALLWWLGTGPVKGFALTLAIGVLVSLFSAITVTRTFLFLMTGSGEQLNNPEMFGVKKSEIAASKA